MDAIYPRLILSHSNKSKNDLDKFAVTTPVGVWINLLWEVDLSIFYVIWGEQDYQT